MSSNAIQTIFCNHPISNGFGPGRLWIILLVGLFCSFPVEVVGQNRANDVPEYEWIDDQPLPTVNVNLSGVNSDDITIAVATDPNNFVYTLTFGEGVTKRNPDGTVVEAGFITGLNSPLDMAIDNEGYFYIADYLASGTTSADNGKIKVFDPQGNFVSERTILTGFYRPIGLDVDDENVYVAEYNDGSQGPERNQLSRVSIYSKISRNRKALTDQVDGPFRIAVNSQKKIYVSQAGDGRTILPALKVFNQNLNLIDEIEEIESPGSVVIDAFDYIHVIEYSGRVNFGEFINFESLGLREIQDLAEDIDNGIDASTNTFKLKVFDPQGNYKYPYEEEIEFPVDIAFNSCDRMYINDADVDGRDTFLGYIPERIRFNLEIYERTPSADVTPPVAICVGDYDITLSGDESVTITAEDIDNGSYDLCGEEVDLEIDITKFTTEDEGDNIVTLTVTDEFGYESTCKVTINVFVEEEANPPEAICNSFEVALDGNGNAAITAGQVYGGDEDLELSIDINSFDCSNLGDNTVVLTVTDRDTGLTDTCEATITVVDEIDPVANCFPPFTVILNEDGEASITVTDIDNGSTDNCGITTRELSQYDFTRDDVGVVPVTLTITDTSGLPNTCTVNVTVENSPPEAICNSFEVALDGNGNAAITAEQVYGGGEDLQLDIDINSFDCSNLGDNIVVLSVTDRDTGLTDTCEATITVLDEIDPTISCPDPITATFDPAVGFEVPDFRSEVVVSDNCTSEAVLRQNLVQDPAPGDIIYASQDISFSVEDAVGRKAECSFELTLKEEAPQPTIICPSADEIPPINLDENCDFEEIDLRDLVTIHNSTNSLDIVQTVTRNNKMLTVKMELQEAGTVVDECTFFVNLIDNTAPEIDCPDSPLTLSANDEGEFIIPDFSGRVTDSCDTTPDIVQTPGPGTKVTVNTPVKLTATDDSNNLADVCEFMVKLEVEEPQNEAPVAVDDQYTVIEDEILGVEALNGVLKNDNDPDGEQEDLIALLVTPVQSGTLDFDSDGSFTYTPNPGFVGNDEFTYRANDGELNSNLATVRIEVTSTDFPNFSPFAENDNYTTPYETTLNIEAPGVLENDEDDDIGQTLTSIIRDLPEDGTVTLNSNGSFTYIPDAGFTGEDSFTYVANDGFEDSSPATVTIMVGGVSLEFTTCPGPKTGTLNQYCSFELPDYTGEARTNIPANITQQPTPGSPITKDTNVSIIATTSLGEAVVCYVQVNVDTTLPTELNCPPQNIEADYDPNMGYFIGSYISRYGLEHCERNFTVVQTPEFGTPITRDTEVLIRVSDNTGRVTSCEFTVFVPGSDPDKLVARNDQYNVEDNSQLYFVSEENGILNNDDFNPAVLPQIEIISQPQGTVDMDPDGSFTYNPVDNFTGEDSFTYLLNNGTITSEIATVTFNVSGEVSSDFACVPEFELQLNGAGVAILTPQDLYTGDPGNKAFTLSQTNFDCDDLGENEVTLTYDDGNCPVKVIVKDEIAPTISCSNRGFSFPIQEDETFILTTEKVDVSAFSSDNCGIVDVVFDRTEFTYADIGIHTIGFTVFDAAGNSDTCQFDLHLDPYRPGEFQCLNEEVVLQLDANGQAELFPHDLYTGDPGDRLFILSKTNFDCSNLGENVVTYSYIGEEGAGSCSANVIVKDEIAPTISCSNREFSFPIREGETFTLTTEKVDVTPFTSDNCEIVEVVFDRTDFTYADIGIHTIGYTVFDAAGNSDTCEFDLLLEPYIPGDFECVNEVVLQLDENGQAELFPEDLYTGEPGDREFTLSKTNFDCSNLGENIVTVSYSGSVSAGSCSVNVIVKDEIAPVVLTNDVSIFLDDTGRATLDPETIDAGSTDNCGEVSLSLDKTNFSCKDLGETEVTLTVTDALGNSSTGTALVTLTGTCEGEEPDEEEPGYIFIYPNPTSGLFNFSAPRGVTISRVEAYDYRARFILAKDFPEGTNDYQMDITGVEQAVYILKLFTSRGMKILRVIKH